MTRFKSSESPLQNMLKIFVDDQKLKKLCVSTFESAHVFLLAFCHIEPSALRIRFFWSHHSNFFSNAPLKKVKTPTSFFCSRGCNDLNFFSQTMIFFDLKIFQYGESLTTHKISLGDKIENPLFWPFFIFDSFCHFDQHFTTKKNSKKFIYYHDREQRSIVKYRKQLFRVDWALQVRHRRYGVWFNTTPKHYRRLLRI